MSKEIVITDPQTPIPEALDWTYGELVNELIARNIPIDIAESPFAATWLSHASEDRPPPRRTETTSGERHEQ